MTQAGLPSTWAIAEIGQICSLINGKAFKPSDWTDTGLPFIRIQNLNNPSASFNHFDGSVADQFLVQHGELLFAWSGTPGTSFGAHIWSGETAVLNQHIFRVLFNDEVIEKRFLRLAINQKLEELIGKARGGVGLRHVTKGSNGNSAAAD
jgi:type I restriction enzyme, S subunit